MLEKVMHKTCKISKNGVKKGAQILQKFATTCGLFRGRLAHRLLLVNIVNVRLSILLNSLSWQLTGYCSQQPQTAIKRTVT